MRRCHQRSNPCGGKGGKKRSAQNEQRKRKRECGMTWKRSGRRKSQVDRSEWKKCGHSPWHQRCMWLLEQVRGCRGRQHKLFRNCGSMETNQITKFNSRISLCMQTQMVYSSIEHHRVKQLHTVMISECFGNDI